MSVTYDDKFFLDDLEVPDHLLDRVMETPQLLPGECQEDYFLLLVAMANELDPGLDLEWLLAIDLAWLFWEIERYRRWKNAIILTNRRAALEEALIRSDPASFLNRDPTSFLKNPGPVFRGQIRLKVLALEANRDPEIAAQLKQDGYDDDALNASAFMHGVVALATVEKFLASARQQLRTTLREAIVRREFKLRADRLQKRFLEEHRQPEANRQQQAE
jgi:hypothetical protein